MFSNQRVGFDVVNQMQNFSIMKIVIISISEWAILYLRDSFTEKQLKNVTLITLNYLIKLIMPTKFLFLIIVVK